MDKGEIISFMGIGPKAGEYWTTNRHNCLGRSQIKITIKDNGDFKTSCPCCGDSPTVLFEFNQFSFFAGIII